MDIQVESSVFSLSLMDMSEGIGGDGDRIESGRVSLMV